jgi:prolyl 4-hydroxylase
MPIFADLVDLSVPLWGTVDGVLSPAECDALVARIDAGNPTLAPIHAVFHPGARNNTRVMFEDAETAEALFARVRPHVPAVAKGMRLVGANELLRCYRYAPGERFAPHLDGSFSRSEGERSLFTLMVYLTEDFQGGETALLDLGVTVVPKRGLALFFQHAILHEGVLVRGGLKYAVRSDLMYRRPAPGEPG